MTQGEGMDKWPAAVIERHSDGSKSVHYFESMDAANLAVQELSKPDRSYEIVDRGGQR